MNERTEPHRHHRGEDKNESTNCRAEMMRNTVELFPDDELDGMFDGEGEDDLYFESDTMEFSDMPPGHSTNFLDTSADTAQEQPAVLEGAAMNESFRSRDVPKAKHLKQVISPSWHTKADTLHRQAMILEMYVCKCVGYPLQSLMLSERKVGAKPVYSSHASYINLR